jgi:hypothetical protein
MATAKKTTVQTFTLEEAAKILADRKKAANNARKGRKDSAGFHRDDTTPDDATYNVLAKGEHSDGEGRLMECRALMAEGGKVRVTVYPCGPWFRGVSAVGGTVAEASASVAELLIAAAEGVNAAGKDSMAATLSRDYVAAAKSHTYNPPKRDRK